MAASLISSLSRRYFRFLRIQCAKQHLASNFELTAILCTNTQVRNSSTCKPRSRVNSRSKIRYRVELYKRRLAAGPEPETHPSSQGCWNHDTEIYAFGQRFGEEFDEGLLKRAFIQRSYVEAEETKRKELGIDTDEVPLEILDNRELAEKGYDIASRYIKAYLRHAYPHMFEDGISAICDYLMSDKTLLFIGQNLGLRELIMAAEYPPVDDHYVKTFLAVIGALAESQDVKRAEMFVNDFILPQLIGKDINEMWHLLNPMGLLAAMLKTQGRGEPEARLLWSSGSDTILTLFHVGIYSDKQLIGKSPGETISIAEELAAKDALKNIMGSADNRPPLKMGEKAHNLKLDFDKKNMSVNEVAV